MTIVVYPSTRYPVAPNTHVITELRAGIWCFCWISPGGLKQYAPVQRIVRIEP